MSGDVRDANFIPQSQHVFIAGQNGSGKSYLAERYLAGVRNVVMLDTKGEMLERYEKIKTNQLPKSELWVGANYDEITLVEHLEDVQYCDTPKIIYSPTFTEMTDEYYNEFYRWIYFRKNCTVWTDEAMSVSKNGLSLPEWWKAILTRGRSRNTSSWALTQRPKDIAQIIMSESKHFFVFALQLIQDREKLAKMTGAPEFLDKPPRPYEFWYFKDGWTNAVLAKLKDD